VPYEPRLVTCTPKTSSSGLASFDSDHRSSGVAGVSTDPRLALNPDGHEPPGRSTLTDGLGPTPRCIYGSSPLLTHGYDDEDAL
jgi:hypothetical protein